jgi:putative inorganic carbon (HCO3(-)) transporter
MYTVLILGYFLVVNLMNTKEWLDRCIAAVAIPSGIIAAIGILGYATVSMPARWIDTEMFADIGSRAVSTFDNPNMLATYLLMTAPFIWIYLRRRNISASGRIIALVGGAASVACMVLTWSRGGWLGMITAALIFLLINYRYVLKYFIVAGLLSPAWIMLLPNNVISRFASIGNLADSSTYYRIYTWKGTLKLLAEHFVGGIGVGHSAFSQIYPLYAYVGTEITMHSHNLFLELAVEIGIMGLLIFLIIMFVISQRGFGCIKHHSSDRSVVTAVSASIAGIAGALVHGMVDHIWYNYRVFFMFWVVAAIACAFANVYPKRSREFEHYNKSTAETEASLDIIFGQKNEA